MNISKEEYDLFIDLVKDQNPSEAEIKLHFFNCARHGVHPLDRRIAFTKRDGKYVPITTIDFLRSRAASTGEYAGSSAPVYERDSSGLPISASVTVKRLVGNYIAEFTSYVLWKEFAPENVSKFHAWRRMPFLMLGKVAEAHALRKAFPEQLGQLYTREEFGEEEKGGNEEVVYEPVEPKQQKPQRSQSQRPYSPTVLREKLLGASGKIENRSISDKDIASVAACLDNYLGAETRHRFVEWVFGNGSLKEIDPKCVRALMTWLKPVYDTNTKKYVTTNEFSLSEIQEVAVMFNIAEATGANIEEIVVKENDNEEQIV